MVPFLASSINVALPPIGREFQLDAVALGWVSTAFVLASAALQVPFGRLADIHGRRRMYLVGGLLYIVANVMLSLAPDGLILMVGRVTQGVAGAMQLSTGLAMLTSILPPEQRGRALGINTAAVYSGLSAGPVLGGLLTQSLGWRSIFIAAVPIGLAALLLVWVGFREGRLEAKGEKLDLPGSIIYSLMLLAVMLGFSWLPEARGAVVLAVGLVGVGVFIWWENRISSPVLNLKLFRNSGFALSTIAALIHYAATNAVAFLLSLYLQYIKGLSPQEAGILLIAQPILQVVFSPIAGRLSDRIPPGIIASVGMGLSTIGLGLLIILDFSTSQAFIIAAMVVLGLGFGVFSAPNTNAVLAAVEKRDFGVATGVLGSVRSLGMMLSMGITMLVFSSTMGRAQVTPEVFPQFLDALHIIFIIFAVLCLLGTVASAARGGSRTSKLA
jgi:EmrB/QacA subfamily drug resistance transporter